jgi:hypothetical protein
MLHRSVLLESFLFSFFLGSFRCIHLMDAESIFSENLIRLYALIPFQIKLLKVFLLPPLVTPSITPSTPVVSQAKISQNSSLRAQSASE